MLTDWTSEHEVPLRWQCPKTRLNSDYENSRLEGGLKAHWTIWVRMVSGKIIRCKVSQAYRQHGWFMKIWVLQSPRSFSMFFFCWIFLGTSVYFWPFYILTALLWVLWNLFCVDFLGHRIKNQPKAQQQASLKETASLGLRQPVSNSVRQWLESWVGNEGFGILARGWQMRPSCSVHFTTLSGNLGVWAHHPLW